MGSLHDGYDEYAQRMRTALESKRKERLAPERVYLLRTALRRLRAIGGMLADAGDNNARFWKKFARACNSLRRALGPLRDIDVVLDSIPLASPRRAELVEERARLARAIPPIKRREWTRRLERGRARLDGSYTDLSATLGERLAAVRVRWQAIGSIDDRDAIHSFRIHLRRFRYCLVVVKPQLDVGVLDAIKSIQKILGEMHDHDLLREVTGESPDDAAHLEQFRALVEGDFGLSRWESEITLGHDPVA